MSIHSFHVSPATITAVSDAAKSLMDRPRFGLPAPVTRCEIARDGTVWGGNRIHFWITICGNKIGLRIFEHPSRPKRRVIRELTSKGEPPTLFVYAQMSVEKIVHKLAQCIKTGLSRLRRGFISILRPKLEHGLINRCDAGSNLFCGFRSAIMHG